MRKMIYLLSALVLGLIAYPLQAQEHRMMQSTQGDSAVMKSGMGKMQTQQQMPHKMGKKGQKPGMMQGKGGMMGMMHGQGGMMGMMHGQDGKGMMGHDMMMSPVKMKVMPVMHKLLNMQEKLKLSDKQIEQLKQIKMDFEKGKIDRQAKIKKLNIDLKALVDKNASAKDIRKVLEKISALKVTCQVKAYETANKMLKVLTPQQKKQWDEWLKNHKKNCCMPEKGKGMMQMHQK